MGEDDDVCAAGGLMTLRLQEGGAEHIVRKWRVPTQQIPLNEGSTKGHPGKNGDREVETPVVT